MKLKRLDCPYCGADLVLSSEESTFFCSHCGRRIALEEDEEIKAKIRIREMELEYEDKEQERKLAEDAEHDKHRRRASLLISLFWAGCIIAIGSWMVFGDHSLRFALGGFGLILALCGWPCSMVFLPESADDRRASEERAKKLENNVRKETEKLENKEKEILNDIQNKHYDVALVKAQTLVYSLGDTTGKNVWQQKQKDLIKTIERLMKGK
ncbi:MAG: hypothetical protein IKP40_09285 [Clostridia bacterium]|nr:hypothetical protein [Clostridia bacterium]